MICLKNRTFAVSQTTSLYSFCSNLSCDLLEKSYFCSIANNKRLKTILDVALWFAWKIVLLQYRKQRTILLNLHHTCCDLLEKSYFCSIANNLALLAAAWPLVVICLKNRTFAVSQTTIISLKQMWALLWFAWKIVLLQYRKQHSLLI